MADQQSRGGKKQGGASDNNTDQHQGVRAGESRRESSKPSAQGFKPEDRPHDGTGASEDKKTDDNA